VRSGGLDIYCYLGVGQDDFPLGGQPHSW